jgi:hypothetical protein
MDIKICERCGNTFEGRANKVYCSIACKSAVNNGRQLVKTQELVDTNKILRRNRRILSDFYKVFQSKPFDAALLDNTDFDSTYSTGIGKEGLFFYEYSLITKNKNSYYITKTDFSCNV